jgi:hypothetical protein
MVPEECVRMVPHTTCTLEPYCVTYKVCKRIPVCVAECVPCCPAPAPCCGFKTKMHGWLSRYSHRRHECCD